MPIIVTGNLVRLIVLFHLPITAFSAYQWTIQDFASVASVVLAGLAFAFFSVALPVFLLYRIWRTPTAKLYDAMRTLLALGPMYNIYAQGNQLYYGLRFLASLVTGITVGVGQDHGLAQAIVLLVVEIVFGLGTTIWHPWRAGAGMVIPGFLFAMIRILSAALLVVMAPSVSGALVRRMISRLTFPLVTYPLPCCWLDRLRYSLATRYRSTLIPHHAYMQDPRRPYPSLRQNSFRRIHPSFGRWSVCRLRWSFREIERPTRTQTTPDGPSQLLERGIHQYANDAESLFNQSDIDSLLRTAA